MIKSLKTQSLPLTAVIWGETNFCRLCAEYLLAKKWKILLVVTADKALKRWAEDQSIVSIHPKEINISADFLCKPFYLFSIINPFIINPDFFIKYPVIDSFNYHDSLLPKYMGVNSTTWALLNNEKQHGVTWHRISQDVDSGDIFKQVAIDISTEETAQSLNLKCTEQAYPLFQELVQDIENEKLKPRKQDLSKRSYYGKTAIPENYAIISSKKTETEISTLFRALTFGEKYSNPVATVKIKHKNQLKIVEEYKKGIFKKAYNLYGEFINKNINLNKINDVHLSENENKIIKNIKAQEYDSVRSLCALAEINTHCKKHLIEDINDEIWSVIELPDANLKENIEEIVANIHLIILKIFQEEYLSTIYYPNKLGDENHILNELIDTKSFLHVESSLMETTYLDFKNYIKNKMHRSYNIFKDCEYRNKFNLKTEVALYLGKFDSFRSHALTIHVSDNEIKVKTSLKNDTFKNTFLNILDNLLKNKIEISHIGNLLNINLLNSAEYEKIVYQWNRTDRDYPKNQTLNKLFELQVEMTPDAIALASGDQRLTYQELNEKSNQVAHYIRYFYEEKTNQSLRADTLIALCIDRSIEAIIGILGILKAGGAYVPIDPNYPQERINYILKDTQVEFVLTQRYLIAGFKQESQSLPTFIALDEMPYADQATNNLAQFNNAEDLAYVIYTSGTTGKPKGVMVSHRGIINTIYAQISALQISAQSCVLQFASFSFDASVWEIFGALLAGARLFIGNKEQLLPGEALAETLEKQKISIVTLPPTALAVTPYREYSQLKTLVVAGEACSAEVMQPWSKTYRCINAYGPTEASVCAALWIFPQDYSIPLIGKPIANTKLYVLDSALNPLPIGVTGELYIAGAGLANGYLNRVELTAERFIVNPYATESDKANGYTRLYKTGDLARWLPDGNLEYIGRNDFQVKIRGYRIELAEIENNLLTHPLVKQVVVLAKEHGENNKYLVAYYIAEAPIHANDLIQYLAKLLPEYMIPTIFVYLRAMPLTISGKINRNLLPTPTFQVDEKKYVAPRNKLEEKICEIWQKILRIKKIGIYDNFFRLGGNSISAIQASHQISEVLHQHIVVFSLFQYNTVASLAKHIETNRDIVHIEKLPENIAAPLSYGQERLWFIEKFEEGTNVYNIPIVFALPEKIKLNAFKRSLQAIVERHEILRTIFMQNATGEYYQQILTKPLAITDEKILQKQLQEKLVHDVNHIFNLESSYPIKVWIYHTEKNRHYALINIHHIAFDGWSMDIFIKELQAFYIYYTKQAPLSLLPLEIQYRDFAQWQREYLSGDKLNQQINYWKSKLHNFTPLLLPTDKLRPALIDYHGEDVPFEFGVSLSNKLRKLAKEKNTTLFTILLSGFYVLLNKYSGQEDIVIGSPVANRQYRQIENLIGFFVNDLILRAEIKADITVEKLISITHQELIDAQRHQELPFEKLVDALNVEKDLSRHPIFQVMFILKSIGKFGNDSTKAKINFKSLPIEKYLHVAKFDLSLFVDDTNEMIKGICNYAVSLYHSETINLFIKHYLYILKQFTENSQLRIEAIHVLTPAEYKQIVVKWNETDCLYPSKTAVELFEKQVELTPNNIAAVFEEKQLTYHELNEKANQLARYIREVYQQRTKQMLQPDTLVAICVERSIEMVIGILGILKAGAAYVPIDPNYPQERIQYILNDTASKLVLSQRCYMSDSDDWIALDEVPYINQAKNNLLQFNHVKDLIYVIYTSGTTGKPKGVMIEHRSVVSLVRKNGFLDIREDDVFIQLASPVFDAATFEIWGALLNGAKLVLPQPKLDILGNIDEFKKFLIKHRVSILWLTKTLFDNLYQLDNTLFNKIRYLLTGGEALAPTVIRDLCSQSAKPKNVLNGYGPTEGTTFSTVYFCNSDYHLSIPIGKPFNNRKAYVLDKSMNPVPIGVAGELYIAGVGLSRGYLNHPELTAERFIANPFASETDKVNGYSRLYKTGDLVRWLSDGNLEYIGRNDFQVKIRGYRIELAEIENNLLTHPLVKQAVVLLKERDEDNKYLVAYYVSEMPINADYLIQHLTKLLPEYMIPSVFVYLHAMPLTINGKINRSALPDPEFKTDEKKYVAPRNELEAKICAIWEELLGLEKISIHDGFFRIGGDSILSIQLTSRMRKQGIFCHVKDIFEYRTIERLAKYLQTQKAITQIAAEQGDLSGSFALLPIQRWFFSRKFPKPNHWNQSFLIQVPQLNTDKLVKIIAQLVMHHDVLRLTYAINKYSIHQIYHEILPWSKLKIINRKNLTDAALQKILTAWQSKFNIKKGPLWQIGYIHGYADGSVRLYFALHHLIVDTVSWRILIEDIKALYEDKMLAAKTSSYRQWVKAVEVYPQHHAKELIYWEALIKKQRSLKIKAANKSIVTEFKFSTKYTRALLQQANVAFHTEINDLLLTALAYALQDLLNQNENYITLEGHGRETIDKSLDVSRTVGWFTTAYPIRLQLQQDLSASIKNIKEDLRAIPNKGIGYGAFKYSAQSKHLKSHALPLISFNYLGRFNNQAEFWHLSGESAGNNIDPHNKNKNLLDINGWVLSNELHFNITSRLSASNTKKFIQSFQDNLKNIINFCTDKASNNKISYTPSDFNTVKISQTLLDKLQEKYEIEAIYPAMSLQQGFIYHVLSQPDDDAYRVQMFFDIYDKINPIIYKQAWEVMQRTYPILRTCFNWEEMLIQIITRKATLIWYEHDITHEDDKENSILQIQHQDRLIPFDLEQPNLFRIHLIKQTETHYVLLTSAHHSIVGGWSWSILLNHVQQCYQLILNNQQPTINEELTYLEAQEYYFLHKKEVTAYWQSKIKEVTGVNDLGSLLDFPVNLDQVKVIKENKLQEIPITDAVYQPLKDIIRREGITLSVLLQFAWLKLINIYTQDMQTIIGVTISGRDIPINGIENSVGFYINTLPLIVNWEDKTILAQLQQIHRLMTDLNNYSYVDLASLQHGTQRLFHSLFVFENYPTAANPEENQTKIIFRKSIEKLDYPLGLLAYENEVLHVQLKYAGEYLTEEKAMTILKQLNIILAQIPDKINQSHQSISLLTTAEYDQIVKQWNETDTPYPKNKTLTQLFETQVEKAPNNVAVIFEERKITYRELNEKANQLANHIRKIYQHKVGRSWRPNTLIAICIERSIEMIIGILAILKAGAVYVPIDPNYPRERIQYILDDTKTELVLSRQHFDYAVDSIILDEVPYADYSVNNLEQFNNAEDLAYVIYTSGTTGKPKGVMIPHRGVVNTIAAQINSFKISNQSSVLQFASFTFDASVSEIFSALLSGAQLFVGNKERLLPGDALAETLEKYGISVATIPPTALAVTPYQRYSQLQTLIVAGEACSAEVMQSWSKTYRCINAYGPTEASICAALWIFPKDFSTPLLGKPIANVKLYVLDSALNPLPTDVTGELYITGAGLARGYLNREKLTAERFILNPFASEIDKKNNYTHLYKTGDLVRWLSDGNLEYIGRNDFQVKIRGYRIELGEIENNLMTYSLVKQAVVLLKEHSDNKYLVAYYVAKSAINSENLIRHLKKLLPEYMIPAIFIHLRTMPLTISGKIDRKALPAPEFKTDETKYVAPRNDLEEKISVIWQKLLNIKKISIHDDFFRIGGDSISSIQLTSRLKNEGIICHVKDIFEYRTIENLAKYLQSEKEIISIVAEHGNLSGSFNLLPIQQWFFSQQFTNPNYWNQSFLVYVPQLDLNKITRIISKLAAHHDVLRLTYLTDKDPVQQIYHETLPYPDLKILNCASLDNMALQKVLTEWQRDFNIKKGPLWQIGYIDGYADGSARLYFALHHLIVDTVSWHILIEDVKALYEGKTLAAKTSSYRQWVKAVEAYPQQHPQEINYWETLVEKHLPLKIKASGKPVTTEIKLSKKYTQALLQQANEAYHTEINDLLLTALAYALQTWHQRNESYITLEAHGRETIDKSLDVSRTVGWFTVAYPLQLQLQQDFANSIKNIKKILRAVPNKGIGYGAFKYLARSEKLKAHALPLISFNYLGQFNTQTEFWHLSSETAGKSADPNNQDKNLLNINGWVIAGELYFSIVSQLSESDTRKFSQSFQQYLKNIIDHCVTMIAQNKLNYTPSDFDLIQINQLYKKISSVLQSKKRKFELIIPLNEYRSQQKTLFMIHPGNASCEVYRNLADAIISKFYCYGIDNYNFYHEKSVDSLSKLAALYLKEIKRHHNKNEPYFLLGWSLGGHIALEIACLLEKEGVTDITIYLLDTILPDKKLKNAKIITTATEYIQQLENYLLSANYNAKFVQRMKSVYLAETKISNMNISTYLQHTKVILFKASKEDTEIVMRDDDKAIFRHILQTKDNNVRQYCKYLTVIRLDASHYTILQNKAIKDFFILDTKS